MITVLNLHFNLKCLVKILNTHFSTVELSNDDHKNTIINVIYTFLSTYINSIGQEISRSLLGIM